MGDFFKFIGFLATAYIIYCLVKEKHLDIFGSTKKRHLVNKETWKVKRDEKGRLESVTVFRDVVY